MAKGLCQSTVEGGGILLQRGRIPRTVRIQSYRTPRWQLLRNLMSAKSCRKMGQVDRQEIRWFGRSGSPKALGKTLKSDSRHLQQHSVGSLQIEGFASSAGSRGCSKTPVRCASASSNINESENRRSSLQTHQLGLLLEGLGNQGPKVDPKSEEGEALVGGELKLH